MTSNVRDTTRHTDRHVAVAGGPPPGIHHPHAHRQGQYASGEYGISPSPYNNPHQQQQLRQQQQQQQYYSGGAPMPPPSVEYDAYGNHTMPPPPGSMGGHYGGESQSFEQAAMGRSPQQPGIYGGMYPGDAEPLPQHNQEVWNNEPKRHEVAYEVAAKESLVYHAIFEAVKSCEATLVTNVPVFF